MRAFTRKPTPEYEPLPAITGSGLIVEDESDSLAPISATEQTRAASVEPEIEPSSVTVQSPLSNDALGAYRSLLRFASADVPTLGWRHVVFVVTGVVLRPGRAERELRAQVVLLLDGVGSLVIDVTKEAAS